LQQENPGTIAFVTKDFPLDSECHAASVGHEWACEAAVAVRLAREKGRAETLEEWFFANQPTLTPQRVKEAAATVGSVTDFDARYPKTLELVKGDIQQGAQLGVRGTPTFYMNGIRLEIWPATVFQAAVELELRRVTSK
jgi:protein-disulfide isomerase